MNPRIRFLLVLTLIASLQAGLVWSSPFLQNLTDNELRVLALRLAAERNGARSEDLEIIHSATSNTELTRKTTHSFTILDKRQNKRYEISLDGTGQEVDKEGVLQNEQAAYQAKYGKLTPALAKRLETAKPDEVVPINIVIKPPDDDSKAPQRPFLDTEAYERLSEEEKLAFKEREAAFQKALDAYLIACAQRILTPIVEKLSKLGTSVKPDRFFLHISARLNPTAILEVNSWEEVRMIDLDHIVLPELNVSRSTKGAANVEGQGFDGAGVKVGVVDPGGRIQSANPYLTGNFQDSSTVCSTPTAHTTAVAGIIRS